MNGRIFTGVVFLALALTNNSYAKDGFYVTGYVSNNTLEHTLERDTGSNSTPSITTQVSETKAGYGVGAGYKSHFSSDLFFGLELFYNDENNETQNLNNLIRSEVTLKSTYGIKFLAGVDVSPKVSIFTFAGATRLDFNLRNSYPFAPPVTKASRKENAFNFGFGVSYRINNHFSVSGEYSQMNDIDFKPIPEVAVAGKINDNKLDIESWKMGLSYHF